MGRFSFNKGFGFQKVFGSSSSAPAPSKAVVEDQTEEKPNSFGEPLFNSFETEWDEYHCPGAQAERDEEYMQIVKRDEEYMRIVHRASTDSSIGMRSPATTQDSDCITPMVQASLITNAAAMPSCQIAQPMTAMMPNCQVPQPILIGIGLPIPAQVPIANQVPQVAVPAPASLDDPDNLELFAAQMYEAARIVEQHAQHLKTMQVSQGGITPSVLSSPGSSPSLTPAEPSMTLPQEVLTPPAVPAAAVSDDTRTTLILRNLPNDYCRDMVLELLDNRGFAGKYDFFYLPVDFKRMVSLGYGFLNMTSHENAEELKASLHGFRDWSRKSQKVLQIDWSQNQGLEKHIEVYRNSSVMHHEIPERWKPLQFAGGVRIDFPKPTKKISPPRAKNFPRSAA